MNLRRGGTNTGFGTTDVLYVLEVFLMTFTHFQVSYVYVSYKYNTTFLRLDDCKQDIDPDVLAFLLVKYGFDAPGFYPEEFGTLASHFLAIVQLTQDEITPTNCRDIYCYLLGMLSSILPA